MISVINKSCWYIINL